MLSCPLYGARRLEVPAFIMEKPRHVELDPERDSSLQSLPSTTILLSPGPWTLTKIVTPLTPKLTYAYGTCKIWILHWGLFVQRLKAHG